MLEKLKGIYYNLEDKYYDLLDKLNEKFPIYNIILPIEKAGLPSFVILIILLLLFLFLSLAFILPMFTAPVIAESSFNQINISIIDKDLKQPLEEITLQIKNPERYNLQKTYDFDNRLNLSLPSSARVQVFISKEGYYDVSYVIDSKKLNHTISLERLSTQVASLAAIGKIEFLDKDTKQKIKKISLSLTCYPKTKTQTLDVFAGEYYFDSLDFDIESCTKVTAEVKSKYYKTIQSTLINPYKTNTILLERKSSSSFYNQTGSIKALVLDEKNNPVPKINLVFYEENYEQNPKLALTNEEGQALIENVNIGNYYAVAIDKNNKFASVKPRTIIKEIKKGKETLFVISMTENILGQIKANFKDYETKEEIQNMRVTLRDEEDKIVGEQQTDDSGNVLFNITEDKTYLLATESLNYYNIQEQVKLNDNLNLELVPSSLDANLIAVTTFDEELNPVAKAKVSLQKQINGTYKQVYTFPTFTDQNASIVFLGLNYGNYKVKAEKEGIGVAEQDVVISAQENFHDLNLILAPPSNLPPNTDEIPDNAGKVVVLVKDINDNAIQDATIKVYSNFDSNLLTEGLTNNKGIYKRNLWVGTEAYVIVSKEGYLDSLSSVKTVYEKETTYINITLVKESDSVEDLSLSLYDLSGNKVDEVKRNEVYKVNLSLNKFSSSPSNVHLRIFENQEMFSFINLELPPVPMSAFTSSIYSGEEDSDLTQFDSYFSALAIKFDSLTKGSYNIDAYIKVESNASGFLKLGYIEYQNYPETKSPRLKEYKVIEGTTYEECIDGVCYKMEFFKDGKLTDIDSLYPDLTYSVEYEVYSQQSLSAYDISFDVDNKELVNLFQETDKQKQENKISAKKTFIPKDYGYVTFSLSLIQESAALNSYDLHATINGRKSMLLSSVPSYSIQESNPYIYLYALDSIDYNLIPANITLTIENRVRPNQDMSFQIDTEPLLINLSNTDLNSVSKIIVKATALGYEKQEIELQVSNEEYQDVDSDDSVLFSACGTLANTKITGEAATPRILYDWSWDDVAFNQCDQYFEGTYCDSTQLFISIIKRLQILSEFFKNNSNNLGCITKTVTEESLNPCEQSFNVSKDSDNLLWHVQSNIQERPGNSSYYKTNFNSIDLENINKKKLYSSLSNIYDFKGTDSLTNYKTVTSTEDLKYNLAKIRNLYDFKAYLLPDNFKSENFLKDFSSFYLDTSKSGYRIDGSVEKYLDFFKENRIEVVYDGYLDELTTPDVYQVFIELDFSENANIPGNKAFNLFVDNKASAKIIVHISPVYDDVAYKREVYPNHKNPMFDVTNNYLYYMPINGSIAANKETDYGTGFIFEDIDDQIPINSEILSFDPSVFSDQKEGYINAKTNVNNLLIDLPVEPNLITINKTQNNLEMTYNVISASPVYMQVNKISLRESAKPSYNLTRQDSPIDPKLYSLMWEPFYSNLPVFENQSIEDVHFEKENRGFEITNPVKGSMVYRSIVYPIQKKTNINSSDISNQFLYGTVQSTFINLDEYSYGSLEKLSDIKRLISEGHICLSLGSETILEWNKNLVYYFGYDKLKENPLLGQQKQNDICSSQENALTSFEDCRKDKFVYSPLLESSIKKQTIKDCENENYKKVEYNWFGQKFYDCVFDTNSVFKEGRDHYSELTLPEEIEVWLEDKENSCSLLDPSIPNSGNLVYLKDEKFCYNSRLHLCKGNNIIEDQGCSCYPGGQTCLCRNQEVPGTISCSESNEVLKCKDDGDYEVLNNCPVDSPGTPFCSPYEGKCVSACQSDQTVCDPDGFKILGCNPATGAFTEEVATCPYSCEQNVSQAQCTDECKFELPGTSSQLGSIAGSQFLGVGRFKKGATWCVNIGGKQAVASCVGRGSGKDPSGVIIKPCELGCTQLTQLNLTDAISSKAGCNCAPTTPAQSPINVPNQRTEDPKTIKRDKGKQFHPYGSSWCVLGGCNPHEVWACKRSLDVVIKGIFTPIGLETLALPAVEEDASWSGFSQYALIGNLQSIPSRVETCGIDLSPLDRISTNGQCSFVFSRTGGGKWSRKTYTWTTPSATREGSHIQCKNLTTNIGIAKLSMAQCTVPVTKATSRQFTELFQLSYPLPACTPIGGSYGGIDPVYFTTPCKRG